MRKHIEVERHLKIEYPEPERCHIRYNNLFWPVDGLPGGENQVRVFITILPVSIMDLVFGFIISSLIMSRDEGFRFFHL
jgi:hypothetical protein